MGYYVMQVNSSVLRKLIAGGVALILVLAVATVVLVYLNPLILLKLFIPVPSPDEMYPPAPAMPPVVAEPIEDLLSAYETFLEANTSDVFAALQPGLSDSEIDELEAAHSINLTDDLRALYRWRNGTPRSAHIDAFPDHEFVPLGDALAARDILHDQVKAETPAQQKLHAAYAGHRDDWVDLIVDIAGDGYFFDPARSESQGSFFFCFAEDGSYFFYPAFRNYLAEVVEGVKTGVFVAGPSGIETADFDKAYALSERFGAAPQY